MSYDSSINSTIDNLKKLKSALVSYEEASKNVTEKDFSRTPEIFKNQKEIDDLNCKIEKLQSEKSQLLNENISEMKGLGPKTNIKIIIWFGVYILSALLVLSQLVILHFVSLLDITSIFSFTHMLCFITLLLTYSIWKYDDIPLVLGLLRKAIVYLYCGFSEFYLLILLLDGVWETLIPTIMLALYFIILLFVRIFRSDSEKADKMIEKLFSKSISSSTKKKTKQYNKYVIDKTNLNQKKYASRLSEINKELVKSEFSYKNLFSENQTKLQLLIKQKEESLQKTRDEASRVINSCDILSDEDKNIDTVNYIIRKLETKRADSVKEALHMYDAFQNDLSTQRTIMNIQASRALEEKKEREKYEDEERERYNRLRDLERERVEEQRRLADEAERIRKKLE